MSTTRHLIAQSLTGSDHARAALVSGFEVDASLLLPDAVLCRLRALDDLDTAFGESGAEELANPVDRMVGVRARLLRVKLEALNEALYCSIRAEIRDGGRPRTFLQWLRRLAQATADRTPLRGPSFDALDELVSGVLQLEDPAELERSGPGEMVPYQPTPVRHIVDLIRLSRLQADDTLMDLGSGLGHVPLVVSILTGIRGRGVEIQPAYADCAQRCAQSLNLGQVAFVSGDARTTDLSCGTVYYLYSPFRGSILKDVLGRLRTESGRRPIRLCSLGPVTGAIAREPWLIASTWPDPGRVAVFTSR